MHLPQRKLRTRKTELALKVKCILTFHLSLYGHGHDRRLTNGSDVKFVFPRCLVKADLGPRKTKTHCGGNIVSYDVACPWPNVATSLRAAWSQEMFLKIFRNSLFVSATNVARATKRGNIWKTRSSQQCCRRHNVSSSSGLLENITRRAIEDSPFANRRVPS